MSAVVEFRVASPVEPWRAIGLTVVDGRARVGGVVLRFVPVAPGAPAGLVGWTLLGEGAADIDGLATAWVDEPAEGGPSDHGAAILGFDHVVVMTSSLERTCGAIEAVTGEPLKRVRELGAIRQGFHRLGEVIVEVVETAQHVEPHASFWGFVWNVADLHELCAQLGPDVVSLPKPAVQPGRFIATVRAEVGLGMPLALMTPSLPSSR